MSIWKNPPLGDASIACRPMDGVAPELLALGLVAFNIRQARDAMSLQTPVQCRPRQMRDRRLQGIKAIVQWQKRMAPERDDHRRLSPRQDRGPRFRRPGLHILDRRPLPPLRHRLGVDPQLPAQLRERSLPLSSFASKRLPGSGSLYCCSDGVRGRGAAVTNLSNSASFHSFERIAPSNRGIKHAHSATGQPPSLALRIHAKR